MATPAATTNADEGAAERREAEKGGAGRARGKPI